MYYKVDPTIKEMIDYREKTILAAKAELWAQTFVKSVGQEVKSQQRDDDVSTIFSTSIHTDSSPLCTLHNNNNHQ